MRPWRLAGRVPLETVTPPMFGKERLLKATLLSRGAPPLGVLSYSGEAFGRTKR